MTRKIGYIGLLMLSMLMAWSCSDTDDLKRGSTDDFPLKITLSSDYSVESFANDLNKQNLQLYYFKKDAAGDYLFTHASTPDDLKVTNLNNATQIETTVPYSKGSEIKFIVLTDYIGIPPSRGQSFDDLISTLTYKLSGPWDHTKPIPMSGVGEFATTSGKQINVAVSIIRSLAAVDIVIDTQKPDAKFKMNYIKSVRVYRTKDEVTMSVPQKNINTQGIVITPTEVPGALYNIGDGAGTNSLSIADENPLQYTLTKFQRSSKGEIFIPESFHKPSSPMGKVVAIVVGVTYGSDSETEHYYRIDFGEYADDNSNSPLPFYSVLRNHRYTFKLQGAQEPGFDNPADALSTKSSVWVDVTQWETEETDTEINGQYYFKMESSEVHLNEDAGDKGSIPFETNIPKGDLSDAVIFTWGPEKDGESKYFEASIDEETSNIVITTKQQNTTETIFREVLTITIFKQKFKVVVQQGERLPDYVITQKHYKVNGVYVDGRAMDSSNTITLRLYARTEGSELEGLPFHLVAPPVGGIEVNYKGVFEKLVPDKELGLGYQEVTVPVLGKSNLPKDKILSITTDGYKYSLLNVEVPFALTKKVILDFYGVENSGTENLNKLLDTDDFSLNPNSKVFIEDVVLISTSSTDMEGEIENYNPDVIIIRNNYPIADKHLPVMKAFVNKRNKYRASNSIIALSTSPKMIEFMKQNNVISTGTLTDINKVNHDAKTDLKFDNITPVNTTVNLKYRYKLPIYASNMVVNGPFGNIGGRYIVLSNTAKYLYRLSEPTIYKYAGAAPFGAQRIERDDGTSMFSSSNFNILWVGSDTFINSEQDRWMFNSAGQIIDYNSEEYVFKAPNETYNMVLASNGILFANALYWALYNSEYKPSNIQ